MSAEFRKQHLLVAVPEGALASCLRQLCGKLAQQISAKGGVRKKQLGHISGQHQCSNHALGSGGGTSVGSVYKSLFAKLNCVWTSRHQMDAACSDTYLPM